MWLPKFLNYHPIHDSTSTTSSSTATNDDGKEEDYLSSSSSSSSSSSLSPSSPPSQNDYCHSKQKMGPSSITNILPRMERLSGPYGMYATVYGISTKVVHVAHPTPAKIILTGDCSYGDNSDNSDNRNSNRNNRNSNSSSNNIRNRNRSSGGPGILKRRSSSGGGGGGGGNGSRNVGGSGKGGGVAYSLGAIKNPAYDHFDNLFGGAVFTADGKEWKAKRSSVLHCLLRERGDNSVKASRGVDRANSRNSGNSGKEAANSQSISRLELEANLAADEFIASALFQSSLSPSTGAKTRTGTKTKTVNIVTLLQRSTIGLIYRFLTHHDINLSSIGQQEQDSNKKAEVVPTNVEMTLHDPSTHSNNSNNNNSLDNNLNNDNNNQEDNTRNPKQEKDDDSTNSTSSSSFSSSSLSASLTAATHSSSQPKIQTTTTTTAKPTISTTNDNDRNPFLMLSSYLEAITNIRMIILAQSRSIWFLLPRWFYKLVSPMYREEEKQMKVIRQFARCACLNAVPGSPLHSLRSRESHNNNKSSSSSKKKKSSSNIGGGDSDSDGSGDFVVNKDILDEAITLLFAGQDTSAATLSWTLHLLSLYPKVQERLAKEVCDALENDGRNECNNDGDDDDDDDDHDKDYSSSTNGTANKRHCRSSHQQITKKMVLNLPYLDAVIKESMRLYPVAPFVVRRIPHDLTIPPDNVDQNNAATTNSNNTNNTNNQNNNNNNNNKKNATNQNNNKQKDVIIPRDTLACIWIYGLHRNSRCWHRPHDFLPERWIDPTLQELDAGQKNGSFMPFATGPRNCVGQPLAHVVLRIILAKVVHCCEFRDERVDGFYERSKGKESSGSSSSSSSSNTNNEMMISSFLTDEELMRVTLPFRKDMQAGFTVLPTGGVYLNVKERKLID